MVDKKGLIVGKPYYYIFFTEGNNSDPIIETYFYIGCNIFGSNDHSDNLEEFFFQDSSSYLKSGQIITKEDKEQYYLVLEESLLGDIRTLSGASDLLKSALKGSVWSRRPIRERGTGSDT